MSAVAKMAALEAKARGRVVAVIPRQASSAPCLPHWPGHYCALPNALLRSATFAAIGKGQRALLSGALITSQSGTGVLYSGEQLDQSDLDVWIALLQLLQNQPLDQRLETSTYALLKRLGVLDTGPNRTSLKRRIQRLSNCALSIHSASCMYEGGLTGVECLDDKPLALRLNPTIIRLFRDDQFTLVDLRVRQAVRGSPLAQWLHGYYSTHAAPFPVGVGFLHRLSGSNTASREKFLQLLRRALDRLASASAAHGEFFSYKVDGERVVVSRRPSKSQARHLAARGKKYRCSG